MKITAEFETAEEFLAFMYGKLPINEKTRERLVALDIIHEATQNGATLTSVPSENVPTRVGIQYPTEAVQVAPTPVQTAAPAAIPTTTEPAVAPASAPTQTVPAQNPTVAAQNPTVAAQNPTVAAQNPTVAAQNPTVAAQNPTAPAPAPTAAPTPAPVAAPAPLPTTATTYSLDEILKAAASLMDQGRTADLQTLLANYGVPKVSMLPQEQLGAFAADLRQMGASI